MFSFEDSVDDHRYLSNDVEGNISLIKVQAVPTSKTAKFAILNLLLLSLGSNNVQCAHICEFGFL